MKIATFNANSIRSRITIICDWLATNRPDVLCIQETKVQDQDFPLETLQDTGYNIIFKGQKKYNGVAIFAREKLTKVSFGLDTEPKDEARLVTAVVKGIKIVNTYIPQGYSPESDKFQYKLDWFKRLGKYFKNHFKPTDSLIWLGDFNTAWDQRDVHDADQYWGHVCYCQEVKDALGKLMNWGFTDVFRKHCQEGEHYTFWDYRIPNGFKRNIGWRLDYIMATSKLAKKCTKCWIDKEPRGYEKPSDHTFLIAKFNI